MSRGVSILWADQIKHWDCQTETIEGWKLARPIGDSSFTKRLKAAWLVFTGKADAVKWKYQ